MLLLGVIGNAIGYIVYMEPIKDEIETGVTDVDIREILADEK